MTDFRYTDHLNLVLNPHNVKFKQILRYALTRFRFGVSDIKVHRSRFKLYSVDELKCHLRLSAVDNDNSVV